MSSTTTKNVANGDGGKTTRACDSCITKRARWYCAADDAFLCQACDSSVHSANSLARRHERVRLSSTQLNNHVMPTWHHGFTKKARTPRQHSPRQTTSVMRNPFLLVPELALDEVDSSSHEENEAQLLYRVPIFDPFVAELCSLDHFSSLTSTDQSGGGRVASEVENKCSKVQSVDVNNNNNHDIIESCFQTGLLLLPSDIELAEFAANVDSLLGRGLENECMGMEELGLIDHDTKQVQEDHESWECSVKVEAQEVASEEAACYNEMGKESTFELNIDYDYDSREEVKNKVEGEQKENNKGKRKICLQLDYEAVIIAWDGQQKCPWTTGDKPKLDDQYWSHHCMKLAGTELHYPYYGGELGGFRFHPTMVDGGREARVSRYREKRRTRLFSKKIRYEVRKLNAEKRPRMKGRFVKRASTAQPTFPLLK